MRILWVKADFLHPTTKGGHIRTLEMLKRLHGRHEIHYVGLEDPRYPEGPARSVEYSSFHSAIRHRVPSKGSLAFLGQLVQGLVSPLPVAVARYRSEAMKRKIAELLATRGFDRVVCDFLFPAPNIPELGRAVLFAHNVESMIWRRHVEHAPSAPHRAYFSLQGRRMFAYERQVCRSVAYVATVSPIDSDIVRREFGVEKVSDVPTGVDIGYFAPGPVPAGLPAPDLVFVGSMDWMPNTDGVAWFLRDVLPRIRQRRPGCTLAIVGRTPTPHIQALARHIPGVTLTGTVPDVRPYLWNAKLSIVPLRIGGGTRLKIYEAMAAKTPVISTTVGAEGLPLEDGRDIVLADSAADFAEACLALLDSPERRRALSETAWNLVATRFSWESVSRVFESILEQAVCPN